MITPKELKNKFPLEFKDYLSIIKFRNCISNIIHGYSTKFLVVCGPCSIHDVDAAIDYALRLKTLSLKIRDYIFIVMRVYLEKPRTTLGWKGLVNDPYMNGSFNIEIGLKTARKLLIELVKIGLPLATEILSPNILPYIEDLFSWSSIGARTVESQIHREIASSLLMPVGFKNSTDGNLNNAINAMSVAAISHSYIGINQNGYVTLLKTKGNYNSHIILRGGKKPNYYPRDIALCEKKILAANLPLALMVDCSHGNSNKNHIYQIEVANSVLNQIKTGNNSIIGLMLESNINAGNQPLIYSNKIKYGVSITDACIDWDSTNELLLYFYKELKPILFNRKSRDNRRKF